MIVVADAGPINHLVPIGLADPLNRLYGRIVPPNTVASELRAPGAPSEVRVWMSQLAAWCEVQPDPATRLRLDFADPGERAAIALALALRADRLLIDEVEGRAEAVRRRIEVTGTLGVIIEAHRRGLGEFETAFQRFRKTNFYISSALADHARRLIRPD